MADKVKKRKTVKPLTVYVVSGGFGSSGEQLVETVTAQFPEEDVQVVKFSHVRRTKQIESVVKKVSKTGGIIVHTMVDHKLRKELIALAKKEKLAVIDLMGSLIDQIAGILAQKPKGKPGLYRIRRQDYFKRVDAINFTVEHDDGIRPEDLRLADIVLAGVSRCGKTPLSMYLAVQGWKVANIPLVMGIKPPEELFQIDKRQVIGLTIDYEHIMSHRKKRYESLGSIGQSDYISPTSVREELEYAKKIFKKGKFHIVNVTQKPVESIAYEIISIVNSRLNEKS